MGLKNDQVPPVAPNHPLDGEKTFLYINYTSRSLPAKQEKGLRSGVMIFSCCPPGAGVMDNFSLFSPHFPALLVAQNLEGNDPELSLRLPLELDKSCQIH
jgi:hypothetical protein